MNLAAVASNVLQRERLFSRIRVLGRSMCVPPFEERLIVSAHFVSAWVDGPQSPLHLVLIQLQFTQPAQIFLLVLVGDRERKPEDVQSMILSLIVLDGHVSPSSTNQSVEGSGIFPNLVVSVCRLLLEPFEWNLS